MIDAALDKRFGTREVLRHAAIAVERGTVHALVGENGAGKSTLVKILAGVLRGDGGSLSIGGKPVDVATWDRTAARAAGIGIVQQHGAFAGTLSIVENAVLGVEPRRGPLLELGATAKALAELGDKIGLPIDPWARAGRLPLGAAQRAEIVAALHHGAKLLILDEPTAVLTPQETDELLDVMRTLRDAGKSIVFITHKLKEVKAIADRITVVRRGAIVGTARPDASEDELASLMVGRTVKLRVDKAPAQPGEPVLSVADLVVYDERGHRAVDGVSFEVRAGEVLGIAGVQGNGQTELIEAVMSLRPVTAGRVAVLGNDVTHSTTKQTLEAGVGYVPEDRSVDGLVKTFSVAENLILDQYDRPPYARGLALRPAAIAAAAKERIAEFDVRTSSADTPVGTLSGGNQQKVIVARELSREVKLLIAAQPTRGVDVGSTEFIHARVISERDHGAAVLLVSSELDEILALADRIAVMYGGKILAVLPPDTPREQIGLVMAGVVE